MASLVRDCGFFEGAPLLVGNAVRYSGKLEVWLSNAYYELNIGFYDIGAHAPLARSRACGSRSHPRFCSSD